jgi:hypothetical protein
MGTPWLEGYSANAELFMTLPLLAGVWALVRSDSYPLADRRARGWLFASGVAGAVALLIKPSAVALFPLAALWLHRRWRTEGRPSRSWVAAECWLLLGWVAGLLPALAHGLSTVPDRYLDAVLLYRLGQDSAVGGSLDHQFAYFTTNSLYILGHAPILLLTPLGLRVAAHDDDRRRRDLLLLWITTAFAGVALGGNWFVHYYQQLLPPAAIAVALGARYLVRRPVTHIRFAAACGAGVALVITFGSLFRAPVTGVAASDLPEWEPGVSAAAPVAAYLAAHAASSDSLYVVYDHADIYYLSRLRPAARWLHYRELAWTPGAFEEQVARIANPATAPRYIVAAQAFDRFGFDASGDLRAVVTRDYRLDATIAGVPIYERRGMSP